MKNRIFHFSLLLILIHGLFLPVKAEKEGEGRKIKYFSSTSFSCVLTGGNNKYFSISFDTEQNLDLKRHRLNLKASLIHSRTDNERKSEIYYSHLKYERELNSKAYLLLLLRADRNKLAGYNSRFAFSGGGGYMWLKRKKLELSSEGVIGWSSENNIERLLLGNMDGQSFIGEKSASSSFFSSLISGKLIYNLSSTAQLVHQGSFFLSLADWKDVRLNSYTSLSVSISRYFALKTSFQIIYEHSPVPGYKNTDFFLLSSIVIKI